MALKNKIVQQVQETPQFQSIIKNPVVQKNLADTLGDITRSKKFTAGIITAVSMNKELAKCEPYSIISAALLGEVLNLSPSPQLGHYYMVPFKQKAKYEGRDLIEPEKTVATFQLGYKGYIQLAIRSGQYKRINATAIKEGELISWNPLTEEIEVEFIQDDEVREHTPTIGYYAYFELVNGFQKSMYWSRKRMGAHADKYSFAFHRNGGLEALEKLKAGEIPEKDMWKYSSFWFTSFDDMAYKTMLRQLISKWGIMSIDMQTAFTRDMTFKSDLSEESAPAYAEDDVIEAETVETPSEPQAEAPQFDNSLL